MPTSNHSASGLLSPPELTNLSHVELLTPDVPASVSFFTELLGLEVTGSDAHSVYLKAWGEWPHHSLILTESSHSGVGHIAYRVRRPEDVDRLARSLRETGVDVDEVAAGTELGQGDAIRFTIPSGQRLEVLHAFERRAGSRPSQLRNQPARRAGQGIEVPRIDHVSVMAPDVHELRLWLEQRLGMLPREIALRADRTEGSVWMSVGALSHDFAIATDPVATGRLHHVAFAVESVLDYWRFGEMAHERGIRFEGGPGRHGGTAGSFVYVREPGGGNRIELFAGGYLILDPDFQPIVWTTEDEFRGVCVGQPLSDEFYSTGTPSLDELGRMDEPPAGPTSLAGVRR